MKKKTNFGIACLAFALGVLMLGGCSKTPAFSVGADISFVPQSEARGTVYIDENGEQKDVCLILAQHHFDNVRLRIFVNPEAPKGYAPGEGFCDLAHTLEMARRIKAAGMKFTLNFHYSDTWADPDKQFKPAAWEGLSGEALENKLYEYTKSVLLALKEAGVAPQMVQVGNEINHGLVWPDGYIDDNAQEANWTAMLGLYKAGQRAVNEVLPSCKLMVHLALGGENTLCRQFLDEMIEQGAHFDVIGLSYYEQWHETYNDLTANLYDLSERYGKQVCVCEYGANKENIRLINDIVRSVPNGLGYGTMAWEPLRVLFTDNKLSQELAAIYDELHAQYADPSYIPAVDPPILRKVEKQETIIGADISWLPSQEAKGIKFSDQGVQKDPLEIMKEHNFNWIRLRLFVDPTAEGGYSKEGWCGLDETLSFAKRVKAAGMKILLDFHYSDNWADPAKQFTPAAWQRFNGSGLEGQVYRYSNETIRLFIEQGVRPDMVQIGNEINHGMLWPQGKIAESYMPFGVLLRCASAGVRAADPSIQIMVHIACGGQNDESVAFFDKIISRDVKFDIIGQSYYPRWHGTLDELKSNLSDLASRYGKPIIVVEYQDFPQEVHEIVSALPNGLGWGTFIWEATSDRWGGLFDAQGHTTEKIKVYDTWTKSL
jgi:arabinogalactan endo-1,4-beta-galactosidase